MVFLQIVTHKEPEDLAGHKRLRTRTTKLYLPYCEPPITCSPNIDRLAYSVNRIRLLRTNPSSSSCKGFLVWRVLENHFQSAPPSAARMLICTSRSHVHSLLRDKYYMTHRCCGRGYSIPCSRKPARLSRVRPESSALHHSHRTASFSTQMEMGEHTITPASYPIIITTSPLHRTYRHTTTPLAIFMLHTGNQPHLLLHSQPPQYQSTGRLNSITRT
jgi:hypothetical protein